MLQTQKYLIEAKNSGLTIEQIKEKMEAEHGVKMRLYDGFCLLDYSQIEAQKSDPIAIECRSLILGTENFEVVSRKFDRFFNAGEMPEHVADFDFSKTTVFLKEDGSLIGIYFNPYTNRWEISTRGMALGEGEHYMGRTFREMVIEALGVVDEEGFQKAMTYTNNSFGRNFYYTCEWVSKYNKIVTPYQGNELVLLGVGAASQQCISYLNTLNALVNNFQKHSSMNIRMPRMFDSVDGLNTAMERANALPDLQEGFVLYDNSTGKRIKVKAATYVIAHKLRGNDPVPTRKNMLELVLEGEVSEFLCYFPEFTDMVNSIQEEVKSFVAGVTMVYNKLKSIESQKDFALAAKEFDGSSLMFTARKTGKDIEHTFNSTSLTYKMKIFGIG